MNERTLVHQTRKILDDLKEIVNRAQTRHAGDEKLILELITSVAEMKYWCEKLSAENERIKKGGDFLYERYNEVEMIRCLREEIAKQDRMIALLEKGEEESWCSSCACTICERKKEEAIER